MNTGSVALVSSAAVIRVVTTLITAAEETSVALNRFKMLLGTFQF